MSRQGAFAGAISASPFGACPAAASPFANAGNTATTASPFGAQASTTASPFASAMTAPSVSPFAAGAIATGASPFATTGTTTPSPFGQTAQTASPFSQGVQTAGPSPFTSSQASPFAAPSSHSSFAPKASVSQSRPSESQFAQNVQASAAAASPFGSSKAPSPFLSAPTNGANGANGVSGAQAGHGRSMPSTASAPPVAASQDNPMDLLRKVGWQLTSFGDNQATLVSNDTSFEELRWTLMQTPREEWNAVSSKKLEEAKEKFHALQVQMSGQISASGSAETSAQKTSPFGTAHPMASPFAASGASSASPFAAASTVSAAPAAPAAARPSAASPFAVTSTASPFGPSAPGTASPGPFATGKTGDSGRNVSPFATGQARSTSPFCQVASPFQTSSYAGAPCVAGLEPIMLRQHEERHLDGEVLKAFELPTFEWQRIPEVEPPPSVC